MDASVAVRLVTVSANGLQFGVLEAGSGPLALCLHGFPDSAETWRHLLPALARAGFHAVAPFMRGYAPTEVPADGAYHVGALVADAVALHVPLAGITGLWPLPPGRPAVATVGHGGPASDSFTAHAAYRAEMVTR